MYMKNIWHRITDCYFVVVMLGNLENIKPVVVSELRKVHVSSERDTSGSECASPPPHY